MGAADYFVEMAMRVKGARTKSRYRCERRPLANLWSYSVFWCDRIEWPWNSRECKTINAECLATELLPCECVMRCPIASLCSAPVELGFDPLLSRFEPCSSINHGTWRKFFNDFSRACMRV